MATRIAAILGFLGVVLGAFGAHGLEKMGVPETSLAIWRTAVLYQLVHAVAALWAADRKPLVVWLWTGGIVCFSGSLYLLAVTDWKWLGPVTPLGGLLFLAGWLTLIIKPR